MNYAPVLSAAALLAASFAAVGAQAQSFQPEAKGTFMVNVRASDVFSDADNPITTDAGVDTGLHVHVGNSVMPTLESPVGRSHIAVEAILGTTQHSIYAVSPTGASTEVASTWVVPPVIDVQYHPSPTSRLSPYVGIGVNLMFYYAGSNYNGFNVSLGDNVGFALDAGADVAISGPWSLNIDAKKIFTSTSANINDGILHSDVELDPWVLSLGFGRKF